MKGRKDGKMSATPSDMDDPGDGGATIVVVALLVVVLAVIGALYLFGVVGAQSRPIDIDVHPRQVSMLPTRH